MGHMRRLRMPQVILCGNICTAQVPLFTSHAFAAGVKTVPRSPEQQKRDND